MAETRNMEKMRHTGSGVKGYLLSMKGGCHTRFGKAQHNDNLEGKFNS